jgi:hypothetical protein
VGLILDLAVAALALVVIGSLGLLAWTLAVSGVRAVRSGRERVSLLRETVADGEARIQRAALRASAALAEISERTDRYGTPGDRSDR